MSGATRRALLVGLLLLAACDATPSHNDTKQMPRPPPPEDAAPPAALRIEVEIDGQPAPAIDAARLDDTAPDFIEKDRRAWRLETLLGEAARKPGAVISVTGEKGLTIQLDRGTAEGAPIAVLAMSRRGEVLAAMVDPAEPFPPYHGHGGRLGRRGDPMPRIGGVTRIVVRGAPAR